MSLTSKIIAFANGRAAKRFEAASRAAGDTQRAKLMSMVQANAGTEYGKRHDFASIRTVADYQQRVPLITYNDIKDDMERVTDGAKNVLTAEDPVMFAQTSGTTGTPKFIPVTPTDRGREHRDVMRTWLSHAQRKHTEIYSGKVVSLVSPAVEGHTSCGLPYGSTSGHIYRNLPRIITRVYAVPYDVFEIADYNGKYYAIMRFSLPQDTHFLTTANPSSVLKMCEKANEFGEEIIRDVRDGTLSEKMDIEPEIRAKLAGHLRPDPARAKALEQARSKRDGVLRPGDYWPDLSLIGCWKGGTVGHYLEKFGQWFDPDGRRPIPTRDWGYLSSEARGSIPLADEGSKGALTIASNFFEFVEPDAVTEHSDDPTKWPFRTADQVEVGKEYYIFVTTTSGLYRYDINDVIRVEGHYHENPEIVFLRKGRGMTNITGEKLSVNQLISAVENAARDTGVLPQHFKAEADAERSRYVLRTEFGVTVDAGTLRRFLEGVDDHLKGINIEYKAKRDSQRLHAPVLHVMKEGWYERQRREQVTGGKRAFQSKTELLTADKLQTMDIRPELDDVVEMD
ncbi:MAG: GH3 auxin-responsive promoter family protein [Planctomycetes bacterium]|nr:GH3 auxin-responsive promoter family protein [Planctomycetota bacterium]